MHQNVPLWRNRQKTDLHPLYYQYCDYVWMYINEPNLPRNVYYDFFSLFILLYIFLGCPSDERQIVVNNLWDLQEVMSLRFPAVLFFFCFFTYWLNWLNFSLFVFVFVFVCYYSRVGLLSIGQHPKFRIMNRAEQKNKVCSHHSSAELLAISCTFFSADIQLLKIKISTFIINLSNSTHKFRVMKIHK